MGDGPKNRVVAARRRIWESSLKSLEKLVMLALLEHWSASTETFPSCTRLAGFTGLSERAVKSSLAGIERSGLVRVERSNGRSNRYDLSPLFTSAPRAPVQIAKPVQEMPRSSAGDARVKTEPPVHHVPPTGARRASPPVHHVPPKRSIEEIQVRDPLSSGTQTTQLKTYFVELYTKARGGPPDWNSTEHARVGKAFKQLAESYGGDLEVQKGILRAALLDEFSPIADPMVIFKQRDRFRGQEPRRKNQPTVRNAPPQRGLAEHVTIARAEDVFGVAGGKPKTSPLRGPEFGGAS